MNSLNDRSAAWVSRNVQAASKATSSALNLKGKSSADVPLKSSASLMDFCWLDYELLYMALALSSYLVDTSGNLDFPIL